MSLAGLGLTLHSKLLDVGCGDGHLLHTLAAAGFVRLEGVDPFIAGSHEYRNGVRIHKGHLNDVSDRYDLVMFNHSLEHVPDPAAALSAARHLLRPNGKVVTRIPIADSWAFRNYREHWLQIDAPRHIVIPTTMGIGELSRRAGLHVRHQWWDSGGGALWASERYRRDIPLHADADYPSDDVRERCNRQARRLNHRRDGDQAIFVLST